MYVCAKRARDVVFVEMRQRSVIFPDWFELKSTIRGSGRRGVKEKTKELPTGVVIDVNYNRTFSAHAWFRLDVFHEASV